MNYEEAQRALVGRYQAALSAWGSSPNIREAAETLGMDRRAYCDRYVAQQGPMVWISGGVDRFLSYDAAYQDAVFRNA